MAARESQRASASEFHELCLGDRLGNVQGWLLQKNGSGSARVIRDGAHCVDPITIFRQDFVNIFQNDERRRELKHLVRDVVLQGHGQFHICDAGLDGRARIEIAVGLLTQLCHIIIGDLQWFLFRGINGVSAFLVVVGDVCLWDQALGKPCV